MCTVVCATEIHLLSDVLAALQVMVTIRENLRLNNGDDAVLTKTETRVKGSE